MQFISDKNNEYLDTIKASVKDLKKFLKEKSVPYKDIVPLCDLCQKRLVEVNNAIVDSITDYSIITSKEYTKYEAEIFKLDTTILTIRGIAEQNINLAAERQPQ